MHSETIPLPADLKWRRLIVAALFLALLYFFRGLAPVFICFIIIERSLRFVAELIERRTGLHKKNAILSVLTALAIAFAVALFVAVKRSLPLARRLRDNGSEYLQAIFDHPSIEQLRAMAGLEGEGLSTVIKSHAGRALAYATETAHIILFVLIGFVLAVIYLFERDQVETWLADVHERSVHGTLLRWFGYVADAIGITVRMQVVVAVINAVVTLPVLLLLGLPHIPLLFLLILVTGLVPVVGNAIAGAVLCYVAYTAQGAWAVGVFIGTTFVLHKIESYYLSPRLASAHVALPGIVLVISLLLFEQAVGFVGLFLSFPALYVASRIAHEWREEVGAAAHDAPVHAAAEHDAPPSSATEPA
jgi:predicted PurR-regulated permease PerM